LQSLILNIKQFVKNIQTYDLGALKWKKLGKSQNSLVFQLQFGYYSSFCKTGFPLNMAWKDKSFDAHIDIFEGKTLLAFFITKGHLRLSILMLVKNAFCKCFLELKNTLVFTT